MRRINFLSIGITLCLFFLLTSCGNHKTATTETKPVMTEKANFNPPKNLQIKRTYAMSADGVKTGKMEAVRQVDTTKSSLLIKDEAQSLLSFYELSDTKAEETFWFNGEGVQDYEGVFTNLKSGEVYNNKFNLNGNTLHFESITPDNSKPYKQKFTKGKDYHTATIYINPTDREMEPGKEYKRGMLDVSFARVMKLKEKFLRMDTLHWENIRSTVM